VTHDPDEWLSTTKPGLSAGSPFHAATCSLRAGEPLNRAPGDRRQPGPAGMSRRA